MDSSNAKKIAASIFVMVLLLVGILIGTILTRSISNSQNTITSASQTVVTPLEVISPAPGSSIKTPTQIKAMTESNFDPAVLTAVYKVGDEAAIPLKVEKQSDKVVISGSIDPAQSPKGRNTLSIYLYNTTPGQTELIGSAVFYIQI